MEELKYGGKTHTLNKSSVVVINKIQADEVLINRSEEFPI